MCIFLSVSSTTCLSLSESLFVCVPVGACVQVYLIHSLTHSVPCLDGHRGEITDYLLPFGLVFCLPQECGAAQPGPLFDVVYRAFGSSVPLATAFQCVLEACLTGVYKCPKLCITVLFVSSRRNAGIAIGMAYFRMACNYWFKTFLTRLWQMLFFTEAHELAHQ